MIPFGMPAIVGLLCEFGPGEWQPIYEVRLEGHRERMQAVRQMLVGPPKAPPPRPEPTPEERRAAKIEKLQAQAKKLGMSLIPEES